MSEPIHEALIKATEPLMAGEVYSVARLAGPLAALRAVVELHRPMPENEDRDVFCSCSGSIGYGRLYPCATIRSIAASLGVETRNG